MKYFTGIDVSLRFVSICVVDEAGVVRYENKVAAEVELIVASLRRFSGEIRQVGLETGLYEQLADSDVTASQLARRPHATTCARGLRSAARASPQRVERSERLLQDTEGTVL